MIQNAKLISVNTDPAAYNAETNARGSIGFVMRAHAMAEILRNAKRWQLGYQSPESKSKRFGELFDCACLTPQEWAKRYATVPKDAPRRPSDRQRNAKKPSPESVEAVRWWDAWNAEHQGCETVTADEGAGAWAATKRLREDKLIAELIDVSWHQVLITAEWADKGTGLIIPIKCLVDIVPPADHPVFGNCLFDLKSTMNASPRSFSRDAQKYAYDLQGGFYLDMANAATGQIRSDFGHVVLENFPPYEYRTPPPLMSQRFLEFGKLLYKAALGIYCKSLATGRWDSYDKGASLERWPKTDCDDWHLDMNRIYGEFGAEPEDEPEEEAPATTEEEMTYGPN